MKFRLPSLADLVGLFVKPTTVAGAIADLQRAADRAKAVIDHNRAKAKIADDRGAALIEKAARQMEVHKAFNDEADRAERVSGRLAELLA